MTRPSLPIRRAAAGLAALVAAAGLATAAAVPAQAAVPDVWGFAYVSDPSVAGVPPAAHQAGSWPAPFKVHTAPGAPGQVVVRFPRIASLGGVVHVTAVIDIGVWCQAQNWIRSGTDEVVIVRCYRPGGTPVFAPFTVLYTKSSKGAFPAGRAYGYVHFRPGGIVAQFNSVGAVNKVVAGATGTWQVTMPGLGSTGSAGGVQVTAVNSATAAKCEIAGWASTPGRQVFDVHCYNKLSTPLNTGWSLSYQRNRAITGGQPARFGYTFNNKPLTIGPYVPVPTRVGFGSTGVLPNIRGGASGDALVTFPRLSGLPNIVLVSAFHTGPGFCNLNTIWGTEPTQVLVRDVVCYTAGGKFLSQKSFITYTTR